ncbi:MULTISPECIES: hypothetical protein [Clostridium]|jgi:hypothetical protein|uniref:Uncharacterized protein n=1 Tax=Clostridium disporicum TaxID=84024 RepID=A0A173XQD5_9CLOT|nr:MULTISPECIES: hypothetical protein [Clostridium]MBX9185984.1 hypothetical protein [Clostridium sp. K04]MDU3520472.1 hypothetical protein [Clostridium saudiense]MDU7453903.1 hypothetical protein [Clostridium saudiense]CUN54122.1 Uncharacterised protein [Clostridium disporicum]CUO58036.1 Uncharacterised protein [Clostridium disporicum]
MKKIFINGIFIVLLIELYLAKGNESMIQIKVPDSYGAPKTYYQKYFNHDYNTNDYSKKNDLINKDNNEYENKIDFYFDDYDYYNNYYDYDYYDEKYDYYQHHYYDDEGY